MPSSRTDSQLKTWIAAAFGYVYIAWGCTYMALHLSLESLPPFVIAGTRFLLSGVLLLALMAAIRPREFRIGTFSEWRDAFVVGTLLLVFGNGLLAWAQVTIHSSVAALIFGSMPFFIILFDWLRPGGGSRPSGQTVLGLLLGFGGLLIIIKPAPEAAVPGEFLGKVVLVIASISWAAGAVYSRHVRAAEGSPMLPIARQMICGGLGLYAAASLHGEWAHVDLAQVTLRSWLGFGYLVVFGALLGFTAYVWLLRVSSAERVSTISYVNLVVAVLLGWFCGEPITPRIFVGACIIIGSVVLVLKKKSVQREVVTAEPPEA